jgi:hypothetical protein
MVRHRRGIGHKGPTAAFFNGVYKGPDNNRSEIPNIVCLTHVSFDRNNIARAKMIQPPRMLKDQAAFDTGRLQEALRSGIH